MTCPPSLVSNTNGSTHFCTPEPAQDPPGDDRDDQAGADVDGGDLPAEQAEQHADGDLVDHRAGDQEAQRDPDRHAGGDEPDERRDGAAGAERGDHPEPGGHHVADAFAFAAEQGAGAFDAHVGPQHRDDEDDRDQQQRDLDRVVHEEVQRCRSAGHPASIPNPLYSNASHSQPFTQYTVTQAAGRGRQGEDLTAVGGGDPFGDAHHGTGAAVTAPGRAACNRSSASGGQGVVDPPAAAAGGDQAGLAQHLQVVTEQVRGDRNVFLQVAHTRPAGGQLWSARSTGSGPPPPPAARRPSAPCRESAVTSSTVAPVTIELSRPRRIRGTESNVLSSGLADVWRGESEDDETPVSSLARRCRNPYGGASRTKRVDAQLDHDQRDRHTGGACSAAGG